MRISIELTMTDEGQWRARCKHLPGCVAYGSSPRHARSGIEEAISGYFASLDAVGAVELEFNHRKSALEKDGAVIGLRCGL